MKTEVKVYKGARGVGWPQISEFLCLFDQRFAFVSGKEKKYLSPITREMLTCIMQNYKRLYYEDMVFQAHVSCGRNVSFKDYLQWIDSGKGENEWFDTVDNNSINPEAEDFEWRRFDGRPKIDFDFRAEFRLFNGCGKSSKEGYHIMAGDGYWPADLKDIIQFVMAFPHVQLDFNIYGIDTICSGKVPYVGFRSDEGRFLLWRYDRDEWDSNCFFLGVKKIGEINTCRIQEPLE